MWDLFLECKDDSTHTNQWMWYTILIKLKMKIISIGPKIMCQNATLFAHRNVQQVGYRRNITQGRPYTTNTAISILNSNRLTASPLRSGRKQGCSLSWLLLNVVNSYPEKSGKNKKSCLFIWKESIKLSLLPTEIFF